MPQIAYAAVASTSATGMPSKPFRSESGSTAKAPLSVKTNNTSSSVPPSLRSSPKVPEVNSFSSPIHILADGNIRTSQPRPSTTSSPRMLHALPLPVSDMHPHLHSPSSASRALGSASGSNSSNGNSNARNRASTSALPSPAYANTLPATLQSIQMSAQAATLAAVAANVASTSQQIYRANASVNLSSSSSPSSSTHYPLQSPLLYHQQHPLQQQMSYEKHTADLTNSIIAFLSPLLPTEEEYRIKEASRRQLERLANRVSPGAKLLAFGSMANGFALCNSGE